MASLFKRPRSPYHWVKYRDPVTGKVKAESTGLRRDNPEESKKAHQHRAKLEMLELSAPKVNPGERWGDWAPAYIEERYGGSGSLRSARLGLRDAIEFFKQFNVPAPRFLTHAIACEFVPWRVSKDCRIGAVGRNTAKLRFTYLRIIVAKATKLGLCEVNPTRDVEVRGAPAKKKNEITIEDQKVIERRLLQHPQWMREQWLILMRQGCRIGETVVPMDRINTDTMTITFKLKGGALFTTALHPDLLPLVKLARKEKRPTLITPPRQKFSGAWTLLFQACKLPYSAHCTRVTVITRLLRANHSPAKVCAFIGHQEEINRIYRRLTAPDVRELLSALS